MAATHKTNIYSFELISPFVPDEFRHDYLVVFCITNKENEHFNAVKNKIVQIKINDWWLMMTVQGEMQ